MASPTKTIAPVVPRPRGPLSRGVVELLGGRPGHGRAPMVGEMDPYGEDLHTALHTCYELHYRGFDSVDAEWEWDPQLLGLRAELERQFLAALRRDVAGGDCDDLEAELAQLLTEPATPTGPAVYLRDEGQWWQVREYFTHRSIYHLKEADPQAWVIPRLQGQAKASLVAIEFDEFGGGRGERVHAQLFANLMAGAGLDAGYLHYFDAVPAPMLAMVNMMSLFGLHRALRGALVGHFATVEITSPPGARDMVEAIDRFDADPACRLFYTEHIEADAVHEQIVRRDVIGDLLTQQPELTASVVFGIQATNLLEEHLAKHLLECWRAGCSSLREAV